MRIHLPLHPQHFLPQAAAGPSAPPLVQLGGDLVLVELQGELSWEGDRAGGVVGVLGLDRPDKPTLHLGEHHLLHGKFSNLQKPYAVIRRVVGSLVDVNVSSGAAIEGDADEEEDAEEDEAGSEGVRVRTPLRPSKTKGGQAPNHDEDEDEDADEPPLFPPGSPQTPAGRHVHAQVPESSSPFLPPSSIKDYSSELDFSSPAQRSGSKRYRSDDEDEDEDDEEDENEDGEEEEENEETKRKRLKVERKKAERRAMRPERTRYYEVVGVVRKKVVFALRPEPIVTATVLPE